MSWCALADSTLFRLIKEDCRLPLTRKLARIDALHISKGATKFKLDAGG